MEIIRGALGEHIICRDELTYIGSVTRLGALAIPDHFSPMRNKGDLKLGFRSFEG